MSNEESDSKVREFANRLIADTLTVRDAFDALVTHVEALAAATKLLLESCELNVEYLEGDTEFAIETAQAAVRRVEGEAFPKSPEKEGP